MTNTPRSVNLKNGIIIYKQLICSVDIHRKAMELVFVRHICSSFVCVCVVALWNIDEVELVMKVY